MRLSSERDKEYAYITLVHEIAHQHFALAHIPEGARQDLRKSEASIRYASRIRDTRLPEVDRWLKQVSDPRAASVHRARQGTHLEPFGSGWPGAPLGWIGHGRGTRGA